MNNRCPQCNSIADVPFHVDTQNEAGETVSLLCRNSFHPPQAYTPAGGQLKKACGPHCGIKDKMEGHCDCPECHHGKRGLQGLEQLKSLDGKSVRGVQPD